MIDNEFEILENELEILRYELHFGNRSSDEKKVITNRINEICKILDIPTDEQKTSLFKNVWSLFQRLIIHSVIVLACLYICRYLLNDDGYLDYIYALLWSGNAFWLPDYSKWFIDGFRNE